MTALLEEGAKVIQERFGETIDISEFLPAAPNGDSVDEMISLTPVAASPQLPGRAARRG